MQDAIELTGLLGEEEMTDTAAGVDVFIRHRRSVDDELYGVAGNHSFQDTPLHMSDNGLPASSAIEVASLIIVASVGMLGNFGVVVVILALRSLRRASNAFIVHHSLLDFLKAAYCLPFAQTLVSNQPETYCTLLGSSYIVFVTTSAFNLLAMVMNEAYQVLHLCINK